MEPLSYEKRGYLNENYRLFHLADRTPVPVDFHYHTFHKVIFLLAGRASYAIEGERYALEPGDFVLVGRGSIHRPEVEADAYYERVILYISPEYLASLRTEDCDLETCFTRAQADFHYVFRTAVGDRLRPLLQALEQTAADREFGAALLAQSLFMQLMIELNRISARAPYISAAGGDSKIVALLQYLNLHLAESLQIDDLSSKFYISKYHMMRRFKEETGYTVHSYIAEKRLLLARQLLQEGGSITEVCYQSGYQDYSTFSRAYRKRFGASPSAEFRRR